MIEIIRHGMKPKTAYVFECDNCGCIYRSNEYIWNREYGYVSKCPECNKNCELVCNLTSEYTIELTKPIEYSKTKRTVDAEIRNNGHIYCPICKKFIGCCTGENNQGYIITHPCLHCQEE